MEQEWRAGLHGILIVSKKRQAMRREIFERAQRVGANRPAKILERAEITAEALLDQRHHLARRIVGRETASLGRTDGRWQRFPVLRIEIPFTARWLTAFHQDGMLSAHLAIEMLHPPCSAPPCPLCET